MFPKALNVSYKALLSMLLSRFLMKMLPTPDLRKEGSRCDHMIRIGRPFRPSKFIVSSALSAGGRGGRGGREGREGGEGGEGGRGREVRVG